MKYTPMKLSLSSEDKGPSLSSEASEDKWINLSHSWEHSRRSSSRFDAMKWAARQALCLWMHRLRLPLPAELASVLHAASCLSGVVVRSAAWKHSALVLLLAAVHLIILPSAPRSSPPLGRGRAAGGLASQPHGRDVEEARPHGAHTAYNRQAQGLQ